MPHNRRATTAEKRNSANKRKGPYPSLPSKQQRRRHRAELERQAASRGIKPIEDYDKYLEEVSDFWPKEETCDEFIAWLRKSRREGRY